MQNGHVPVGEFDILKADIARTQRGRVGRAKNRGAQIKHGIDPLKRGCGGLKAARNI